MQLTLCSLRIPETHPSFTAEIRISFIRSKVLMCTGNDNCNKHVDAVGLHLQPSLRLCKKIISLGSPNPTGGIVKAPVTNFNTSGSEISTSLLPNN